MLHQDMAAHSQNSPTSSKNSSNDSLNYLVNKNEQIIEKNFNTLTSNNSSSLPYSDSFSQLNYSNGKKKSLKNTFYRIFMQRKKSEQCKPLKFHPLPPARSLDISLPFLHHFSSKIRHPSKVQSKQSHHLQRCRPASDPKSAVYQDRIR